MRLEIKKLLLDISDSIESIENYLGDKKDFLEYQQNKMLRRAVERELSIIGEATSKLLKIDSDFPISEARRIVNLRNWVIHSYDSVDSIIIWGIIHKDLPLLKVQVDQLLDIGN